MTGPSLLFRAGSLLCALPLEDVVETMRPLPVRPLADVPAYVRGVSVLRGVPVPVVDAAALVGGEPAAATRFVSVRGSRGGLALATGEVLGVADDADAGERVGDPALTGITVRGTEPLLRLRAATVVPANVWDALSRHGDPP
ncbi:chemotaxis protein CheW [Pilimelia terevasa]|nr:chemotaxis protein CheW [Pilimelia terevasa]